MQSIIFMQSITPKRWLVKLVVLIALALSQCTDTERYEGEREVREWKGSGVGLREDIYIAIYIYSVLASVVVEQIRKEHV